MPRAIVVLSVLAGLLVTGCQSSAPVHAPSPLPPPGYDTLQDVKKRDTFLPPEGFTVVEEADKTWLRGEFWDRHPTLTKIVKFSADGTTALLAVGLTAGALYLMLHKDGLVGKAF